MELVDSHCHLDFLADPAAACAAAVHSGVRWIVVPGVSPAQWQSLPAFREQQASVAVAVGLHPLWIAEADTQWHEPERLKRALAEWQQRHVGVAVGECGLDFTVDCPQPLQEALLAAHLALASELTLPLILHCRRAHNPLLRLLKRYRPPAGGVLHAFSGSIELAQEYWQLGFRLGVGGTITYPRANKTRNTVAGMPLEALLLETDAPDMPLCGRQGRPNQPAYLSEVATVLAELRQQPVADIARQTTENSRMLFKLA